ncbi:tRNA epoxyqueuosine(34) reductase QueG, partial [Clostridium butyricum]
CGWRGKNILKRNALIRKYIFKNESIDKLKTVKFESPYLEEYLKRIAEMKSDKVLKK